MNIPGRNTGAVNPRLGEAAAWRVRLDDASVQESDFLAFEAWVADPQARAAFDLVERVCAEITDQRDAIDHAWAERERARAKGFSLRMAAFGAAAAAAAVLAVIVAPQAFPQWTTYTVAKGATRTVQLADGSRIVLNTGSSLKVALGWFERKAVMAEGEASFVIAHDTRRPFLVEVADRRVRDVGTEFSVRNYAGQGMVTVRSGLVDVTSMGQGAPMRLAAGDQLVWTGTHDIRRKGDVDAAFAWQRGRLIYNDATLAELAADLNRYFPRPIAVVGPAAAYKFSGVLTLDTEEQVVQRLQAFLPVAAQEADGRITLSASGPKPAQATAP